MKCRFRGVESGAFASCTVKVAAPGATAKLNGVSRRISELSEAVVLWKDSV
jgi:hypothetical protein